MKTYLVVVLVFCAHVSMSSACSCFPFEGPESLCQYDLIFRGQATSECREYEYDLHTQWVYTMQVDFAVKMPENLRSNSTITMKTPVEDSMCGLRLSLHMDGIFFAYVYEGEVSSTHCAPNAAWNQVSEEDRQFFNEELKTICDNLSQGTTTLNPEHY